MRITIAYQDRHDSDGTGDCEYHQNSVESIDHDGDIYISTTTDMLEIADNGAGISNEASQKLFSPFFSTKPNGQGIGLIFIREVLTKHGFSLLRTYEDHLTRF